MAKKQGHINLVFGAAIGLLAATALYSMYQNRNLPVIHDHEPVPPAGDKLPDNHPPIDGAGRIATLEQMSRNDPQNAEYRTQLANAYYDMGQYEKAAEAYKESLRLRPGDPSVETDLATCYHYLGQHDRAVELLDKVLRAHPGFTQALFNKGIILQSGKKDIAGAIAAWESLLKAQPNFPQRTELEKRINELKSGRR